MNKSLVIKLMALLGLFAVIPSTFAHSPSNHTDPVEDSLKGLVSQSDLIIQGQVIDIQYRNSEPTKEQPQGLPHTFVTYQIQDVLRGKPTNKTLTLRIPGGADGQGGIYMDSSAPVFARKQSDVLFIKGGENQDCPLVDCVEGRYRLSNKQVFNGWGVPVVDIRKGIKVGGKPRFDLNVMDVPQPSFEELIQRPEMKQLMERQFKGQSISQLKERYEQEAPKFLTVNYGVQRQALNKDDLNSPEAEAIEKYGRPLSSQSFIGAIKEMSQKVGPSRNLVFSAKVDQKFVVADPKVERFQGVKSPQTDISEEERNDQQAQEEK